MEPRDFFFNIYNLSVLFLAALGLRGFAQAFSSCGKQGLFFAVVRGLLIAVASLVEHNFWSRGSVVVAHGLLSPHGMWDFPGSRMEPMPSALAGGFFSTVPPSKS